MMARLRKPEDLVATITCFGVAGVSLALGMWIAGQPPAAPRAGSGIACLGSCGATGPEDRP